MEPPLNTTPQPGSFPVRAPKTVGMGKALYDAYP